MYCRIDNESTLAIVIWVSTDKHRRGMLLRKSVEGCGDVALVRCTVTVFTELQLGARILSLPPGLRVATRVTEIARREASVGPACP